MTANIAGEPTRWKAPAIIVILAILAMGVLGGAAVGQPVVMIVSGLVWGPGLVGTAIWLARSPRRRSALATVSVVAAVITAGILIGFSILDLWLSEAILAGAPQTYHTLWQPPMEAVFFTGLIILNSTLEWLLVPLTVLFTWHIPRARLLLLIAAATYYAMRAWSYLYFVPQALNWADTPPGQPFTPDMLQEARVWVHLSLARGVGDVLLFVLLTFALIAATRANRPPASLDPTPTPAARPRDGVRR